MFKPLKKQIVSLTCSRFLPYIFCRFAVVATLSVCLDWFIFIITYLETQQILLAVIVSRVLSAVFNYQCNKRLAFQTTPPWLKSATQYAVLASIIGMMSYVLINLLSKWGISVILAKGLADFLLFFISFSVQHKIIFPEKEKNVL